MLSNIFALYAVLQAEVLFNNVSTLLYTCLLYLFSAFTEIIRFIHRITMSYLNIMGL